MCTDYVLIRYIFNSRNLIVNQETKMVGLRLRLPADVHTRLKEEATRAGRSLNSEIVISMSKRYAGYDQKRAKQKVVV